MPYIREEVRSIVLDADLANAGRTSVDRLAHPCTLTLVKVPLSQEGSAYYYADALPLAVKYWRNGNTGLDVALYDSADRIARPHSQGMFAWSEAVDFAVEKELLSNRFIADYDVHGDVNAFIADVERESHLSEKEWATASLIATPILSRKLRENLGDKGAIVGAVLGLLGGPYAIATIPLGAIAGYAFGAMSPAIAGGIYLHHRWRQRRERTEGPLRDGKRLEKDLRMMAGISRRVLETPSSRIDKRRLFSDAFPMDHTPPQTELAAKIVLDVLASDLDGLLTVSDRARSYYWTLYERIPWGSCHLAEYRAAAEILRKKKPFIQLRSLGESRPRGTNRGLNLVDTDD